MSHWIRPLNTVGEADRSLVGGKAARLGQLIQAGFRVPPGFVLSTEAYSLFVRENQLHYVLEMELGRKDLAHMRWEELWDAALRIRAAFSQGAFPVAVKQAVLRLDMPWDKLAVRSSAPAEDGAQRSFAGLHASVLSRQTPEAVLQAIRAVWASLWSDAALLYRRELGLDPLSSSMAVVLQEQVDAPCSGVAFGLDPRAPGADRMLIEAVQGSCAGLVDGSVDPTHYVLSKSTGILLERRRGEDAPTEPLLEAADLVQLHALVNRVEAACGWPADVEWTGRGAGLTVLQARPAGTAAEAPADERRKYLAYCPGPAELAALRTQVVETLIPELEADGARLAAVAVEALADDELVNAITERWSVLQRWRAVYEKAFIPFAHGVRALGVVYNDAFQPVDPHEFVGLLQGESLLATERDAVLRAFREAMHDRPALRAQVKAQLAAAPRSWVGVLDVLDKGVAQALASRLRALLDGALDVVFDGARLANRPDLVLAPLLAGQALQRADPPNPARRAELETRLFAAFPGDSPRIASLLELGRISWRLRDDDNLLVGRVESQLLRAVHEAQRRLDASDRQRGRPPSLEDAVAVAQALGSGGTLDLKEHAPDRPVPTLTSRPRQLVGQPAAPGMAQGRARCVRSAQDLSAFLPGEVLVCDAIQPQMTHLVPLAAAVIERRGGMLIHGAIVARELGIPCVNGIHAALSLLADGSLLTVDGDLGLVTVEAPHSLA